MEKQQKTNLFEQAINQNVLPNIYFLFQKLKKNFFRLPKSANKASQPVTDKKTPPKKKNRKDF
jgi:hypothetical protein